MEGKGRRRGEGRKTKIQEEEEAERPLRLIRAQFPSPSGWEELRPFRGGAGMAAVRRGAAALVARLRAALSPRISFPYRVELKEGKKYAWCSCGHSRAQPFCDGSHRTLAPDKAPVRFTAEADGKVWLCGCKRTRGPPRCDGSHLRLWEAGSGARR